jgi:branched-subunit amino acid ABC-type transport system permease component
VGDFLQTLIIAVTLGSLYALIALGYTMVYGILKLINFAHSDVVVLGAWVSFTLATFLLPRIGVNPNDALWWAGGAVLVSTMLLCGLIGFAIERLAYKPIRKAPRLNALITAIGVSLFLQNVGQLHYTIVPAEKQVASGKVLDRGSDSKHVKLAEPVTIESGLATYELRLQPAGTATATVRKVLSPPGAYAAGQELALDQPIGRAQTRDATFSLLRVSTPLQLPFGAMPAGVPRLRPAPKADAPDQDVLWKHEFTTTIRVKHYSRGSDPDSAAAATQAVATSTQPIAVAAAGPLTTQPAAQPSVTVIHESEDTDVVIVKKPVLITWIDVIIVGTALLLMLALELLVFHSRLGTAMRAVSYNFDTSGLMGIPVDRIISITFVTGACLAAAAGFLYAMKYQQIQQPAHQTWVLLGLKAFVAAVVGGIGNVRGALVGGFLIAFIEQFSGVYFGRWFHWDNAAAFTDVYVFALLIIVLLVKPSGLFGSTVREKV